MKTPTLDFDSRTLVNRLVVEASAGTGKTFSVAGLVAHALAVRDDLRISQILITTYTRNAAAELRDRVRRRLISVAAQLESSADSATDPPNVDPVVKSLRDIEKSPAGRREMVARLRRAEVEFDSATISTIHGVCNRILALAGLPTMGVDQESDETQVVARKVNDALAEFASRSDVLVGFEVHRVEKVVKAMLDNPDAELWFGVDDQTDPGNLDEAQARLVTLIEDCVAEIRTARNESPGYSDLLRRARDVVSSADYSDVVAEFKLRYVLAFVDEAQDTDSLQWDLFDVTFPSTVGDDRRLIAVGDPKQAIYGFRGADVDAYLQASTGRPRRTLSENQRSDEDLVEALNVLFDARSFGAGIDYQKVTAANRNKVQRLRGAKPLELIDVEQMKSQEHLTEPAARRVMEILSSVTISEDGLGDGRPVVPSDVCVLVRANEVGRSIEAELKRLGIPAVSNGTASVMVGATALNVRILLDALAHPTDVGAIRGFGGSIFCEASLAGPRILDPDYFAATQRFVVELVGTLRRRGTAALFSKLLNTVEVVRSIFADGFGERHMADISHIGDLLQQMCPGAGVKPDELIEAFDALTDVDEKSERVARRVEGDSDAVQVMTIHAAKGLQFPVVVVADLWKKRPLQGPIVFGIAGRRFVDFAYVRRSWDPFAESEYRKNQLDESKRLLYVALTRAEHHLSLIHTSGTKDPSVIDVCTNLQAAKKNTALVASRLASSLTSGPVVVPPVAARKLDVAAPTPDTSQVFRRSSFSGITKTQAGRVASYVDEVSEIRDDEGAEVGLEIGARPRMDRLIGTTHEYADDDVPIHSSAITMPMARIPGGTQLGNVVHDIFEFVDTSAGDIVVEVEHKVDRHAGGPVFSPFRRELIDGLVLAYRTPIGAGFGTATLADIDPSDRLSELSFDMSVAELAAGVLVSDIGRLLRARLAPDDILASYAISLCDKSFEIPLAGILTGSIDSLIRVRDESEGEKLYVTDYKTNRLDRSTDSHLLDAYSPKRLSEAMAHHHYPLQALLYGVAVHRMLRWRRPEADSDDMIGGIAYFFVRGMVGPDTPGVEVGEPNGVFHWSPPRGLWAALSDLLAGDRNEVSR